MAKSLRGISVPHRKNTDKFSMEIMPVPHTVKIVMSQNIGKPSTPVVNIGDNVKVGQLIASSDEAGVPIHSSVSGVVKAVEDFTMPDRTKTQAIIIETDQKQELFEGLAPPVITDHASLVKAVYDSGMVGLGGAGFPTHIKFSSGDLRSIDTLLINAAECEPYITSDNRTIIEKTENLLVGIKTSMEYLGLSQCIIGIEDNKTEAIEKLKKLEKENNFKVHVLNSVHPKGAEKVLIYETVDKIIPEGGLPMDVGVLVCNVTTIAELGNYFTTGMPLVNKCITIDGGAVKESKNVVVPIGTSIKDIVDFCGGFIGEPEKIIMGGPMMGVATNDEEFPMLKQNNAILFLDKTETGTFEETPCIRCGECMRTCPMNLTPFVMKSATENRDIESLGKLKVNLCIECGCCSYVCPARQELVPAHRRGKLFLKKQRKTAK